MKILETIHRLDWKVVLSSDSHVHYSIGNVEAALSRIRAVDFPEERIVTMTARRVLSFLGEHEKLVAAELEGWLDSLDCPDTPRV